MPPVVSVLAPSYGHERYLGAAIASVVAQDFEDWELIVVDDFSPDRSLEVARAFSDSRIKIVQNESNIGAYGALSRALAMSRGEWIAVLNTDDVWMPNKLGCQLDAAGDANWTFALGELVDESGAVLGPADHGGWAVGPSVELLPALLAENRLLASSVMFRRGAAGFDASLRTSGDWILALHLAWSGPAAGVAEPLVGWRQHARNSYLRSPAVTLEEIRVRRAILRRAEAWRRGRFEPSDIAVGLGQCAMNQCALYILAGFPRKARRAADLAAMLLPGDRAARRRRALSRMPMGLARWRLWGRSRCPITAADLAAIDDVGMPCDEKT